MKNCEKWGFIGQTHIHSPACELLSLDEVEKYAIPLNKRDIVISSIEFRAIVETARAALKVVDKVKVIEACKNFNNHRCCKEELDEMLAPFRREDSGEV